MTFKFRKADQRLLAETLGYHINQHPTRRELKKIIRDLKSLHRYVMKDIREPRDQQYADNLQYIITDLTLELMAY